MALDEQDDALLRQLAEQHAKQLKLQARRDPEPAMAVEEETASPPESVQAKVRQVERPAPKAAQPAKAASTTRRPPQKNSVASETIGLLSIVIQILIVVLAIGLAALLAHFFFPI